jgi:hypothetical protein
MVNLEIEASTFAHTGRNLIEDRNSALIYPLRRTGALIGLLHGAVLSPPVYVLFLPRLTCGGGSLSVGLIPSPGSCAVLFWILACVTQSVRPSFVWILLAPDTNLFTQALVTISIAREAVAHMTFLARLTRKECLIPTRPSSAPRGLHYRRLTKSPSALCLAAHELYKSITSAPHCVHASCESPVGSGKGEHTRAASTG